MDHDPGRELAQRVKALLGDRTQEVIGDFVIRLGAKTGTAPSRATVTSRISNLVNGKVAGAKYFFRSSPRHGALLLELLAATDEQRTRIVALVDDFLADDPLPAVQLVVDVSDWDLEGTNARAWTRIENDILRCGPSPAVLVLTEQQHEHLPRRFDDLADLVRVSGRMSGPGAVGRAAGEEALVVSSRRFDPWQRWVAVKAGPSGALEPELTRTGVAAHSRTEPPAYLDELAIDPADTIPAIPDDPIALRLLLADLALGPAGDSDQSMDGPTRLALGRALEIRAAATFAECVAYEREVLGGALGEHPRVGEPGDLELLLERARRRPMRGVAIFVGDELHLINSQADVGDPRFVSVTHHNVPCAEPAISQLKKVIADRDEILWLEDPYMESAMSRVGAGGVSRRELLHARATLSFAKLVRSRDLERAENWRDALLRILARPARPARLRVSLVAGTRSGDELRNRYLLSRNTAADACGPEQMLEVRPVGDVVVGRGDQLALVVRAPLTAAVLQPRWERPAIVLSTDPDSASDPELWSELVEASSALRPEGARLLLRGESEAETDHASLVGISLGHEKDPRPHVRATPELRQVHETDIPSTLWRAADRLLAISTWTLREALEERPIHTLHDGTALVAIGTAGFFAEIDVWIDDGDSSAPFDPALDAALEVTVRESARQGEFGCGLERLAWAPLTGLVQLHHDGASPRRARRSVPRGMTYRGEGLYARVRYGHSPLLTS